MLKYGYKILKRFCFLFLLLGIRIMIRGLVEVSYCASAALFIWHPRYKVAKLCDNCLQHPCLGVCANPLLLSWRWGRHIIRRGTLSSFTITPVLASTLFTCSSLQLPSYSAYSHLVSSFSSLSTMPPPSTLIVSSTLLDVLYHHN